MSDSGHHVSHPGPRQYVKIAVLLAAITAIEVALFYVNASLDMRGWDAPVLVILSSLKFIIVIGWYMHLRFENSTLSRLFGFGFSLALTLYAVVLGSFAVVALTS